MKDDRNQHLRKVILCYELGAADPERRQHWLRVAEHWSNAPSPQRDRDVVTHKVHQGRMIPVPAAPPDENNAEPDRE